MGDIVLAGSTSGTTTLTPTAVSGTTTLTLPATTGTVVTKDTNGILSVNGVQFPATQSASADANCLDDYEEGTFTPTYIGASSNPTVTYGQQVGKYTKIGNVVYYFIRLDTTATAGGGGALSITGLPFTVGADQTVPGAYIGYTVNWTTNAPTFGRSSGVAVELYRSGTTGEAAITTANLSASIGFIIGGMYRIA